MPGGEHDGERERGRSGFSTMCTGGGRRGEPLAHDCGAAPPAGAASSHETAVLGGRGLWSAESSTTAEAVVICEPPAEICSLPRSVSTSAVDRQRARRHTGEERQRRHRRDGKMSHDLTDGER